MWPRDYYGWGISTSYPSQRTREYQHLHYWYVREREHIDQRYLGGRYVRMDDVNRQDALYHLEREYEHRLRHLDDAWSAYEYRIREEMYYQVQHAYMNTMYSTPIPTKFLTKESTMPTEPKKYIVINTNLMNVEEEDYDSETFDNAADAEKYAKEQARENKGESYTVFQTYKTFRVTEPVEEVVHV